MSTSEMANLPERIMATLSQQLGLKVEEIRVDHYLVEDLGADSLDTVELVMDLEAEFGLEISDEDAEKMHTVQDIVDYVTASTAKSSA